MRLSRTNFSNGFDNTGDQPADPENRLGKAEPQRRIYGAPVDLKSDEGPFEPDTDAMAEIEGRGDAPVWQSAFVLGPNVRFTRTPESVYSKRPASDASKEPEGIRPVEQAVSEVVETVTVIAEQLPVIEPVAEEAMVVSGVQLLSLRLRQELETSLTEPAVAEYTGLADIDLACFPAEQEPEALDVPETAIRHASSFQHVSDEVFWNTLDMEADIAALAPLVHWQPPEVHSPAGSVTALYREIGIRASERRVVAPVISRPAPLVTPAPIVEEIRPVVAEAASPAEAVRVTKPPVAVSRPIRAVRPDTFVAIPEMTAEPGAAEYVFPPIDLLQEPSVQETAVITQEALEQSAGLLESVLEDFGVRGEIIDVRPGPVVTLYEFEPAPGVKSSRVIGLADDIARSMSALSARVAVVPGRNVIGIELPNPVRETVYFRELIESENYEETRFKLALCLGKTIGGEPVIAELAKMPHLLVAGTTGSGKSVAINTMILSLLYRLKPEECRLIMVDPKMLELSVYDGIPHLLTPVVTDPKKAVMALKWAVREMEDRYRKMSRLGVRNIDGYNARAAMARSKGETILCSVQTGFDRSTGEPIFEQEEMDLAPMPYIVVIVDEMADLMMVAGKEIEGAIQRLAQMARAAGIHLIMATQRPSVDVITGTIKANFPTRISFQVTSKIDSRTILGEQGAEHLLGQGDMLHMVGGGRIARVHGPFVSDEEVEKVVAHLKTQGRPEYLGTVTEDAEEMDATAEEDAAVFDKGAMAEEDGNDLYDKAVKVVLRDKKCSTSYIQRRLQIGYNRAASLVERMEREGLVGSANHVGKRSILSAGREVAEMPTGDEE
ncbi:DNA translocase FtsK [Rhizobium sp. LjRoot98]|uniref:DNA translocase FtsK n=1 Tax=unclassified Rhizobium TaxID=2613769 RepID=UPI0009E89C1F|nr:DNA translocase FtsK [Rhizobium sp. Root1204]